MYFILYHTVSNSNIIILMISLMTAEEHNIIILKQLCTGGLCFSETSRPFLWSTQPPTQWLPTTFPGDKAAVA